MHGVLVRREVVVLGWGMKPLNTLALLFVLTTLPVSAEIGPDGTGVVNGYQIGPGADLFSADLTFADLTGADLNGADLTEADLSRANLSRANLSGA
ncbi:MAG: pentapeptide repeat-containing protein, partial [Verrucomicrobiales bacterium]